MSNSLSAPTMDIAKTAREINQLKGKVAENLMLIGQKLNQVKETLPHGEWANWLEVEVQFSQETARKMMRIAEEFSDASTEQIKKIGSEKLYLMLNVPPEKRKMFEEVYVKEPITEVSTRTLKEAIKDFKDDEYTESQSQNPTPHMKKLINRVQSNSVKIERLLKEVQQATNDMIIIDKDFEHGTKTFHGALRASFSDAIIKETLQMVVTGLYSLTNSFNCLTERDQWTVEHTGDVKSIFQVALEFDDAKKEWDSIPTNTTDAK